MKTEQTGERKRLLVLTSTFPRWEGDSEPPFVFELCRHLRQHFDVVVLAPHAPGAKGRESLAGLEVVRFRYSFAKWEKLAYQGGILANLRRHPALYLLVPVFLAAELISLLRILRLERIDVIHAHWLIPQGLVALAGGILRGVRFPPWLCTSHGSDLLGLRGGAFTALKRMMLTRADAVTVVSRPMRDYALTLGADGDELSVIPMGIDATNLFTPPATDGERAPELLFVGRLVTSKAAHVLIEAMPAILANRPAVTLTIVGDGPERPRLEALVRALGIADKVNFLGAVDNGALPELYRRAAIFVSPSLAEGFGLAMVEAMACGCAVIASDLPATGDIISDGKTGVIVPPKDSAAIAHTVLSLLADPALRRSLGRAGRRSAVEQFDWKIVAARYGRLLDELAPPSHQPSCEHP